MAPTSLLIPKKQQYHLYGKEQYNKSLQTNNWSEEWCCFCPQSFLSSNHSRFTNRSLASGGSNSFLLMGSRERNREKGENKWIKKIRKQNKYILGHNTLTQQVLQIVAPAHVIWIILHVLSLRNAQVPIDFHGIYFFILWKSKDCLVTNIFQNIIFYVQQNK